MNMDINTLYEPYKKVYYSYGYLAPIVDAITGAKYPYEVGSKYENMFFKVRSTIHYKNKYAKYSGIPGGANKTAEAFYESPEHYMNYHKVVLSNDIIDKWKEKSANITI